MFFPCKQFGFDSLNLHKSGYTARMKPTGPISGTVGRDNVFSYKRLLADSSGERVTLLPETFLHIDRRLLRF